MKTKQVFIYADIFVMCTLLCLWSFAWADESTQFEPGFNLFSYPVQVAPDYSAYDFIEDLNLPGSVASIQRLNSETGKFETCVWQESQAMGVDFPITTDEGLIVHVEGSAFSCTFMGNRDCPPVSLETGLSLTGFPCPPEDYTSFELMEDLGPDFLVSIKSYDDVTGTVLESVWDGADPSGDLFDIDHGSGYLVDTWDETTWMSPSLPPNPPENLTAYGGDDQVVLSWGAPEGMIQGYNLYRSTTSGSGYTQINEDLIAETGYLDGTVSNGIQYFYVVTAVNMGLLESNNSAEASATPGDAGPTTIDTDITANTTWHLAGSPFTITGSIQVQSGTTLTIEPGVEIRFNAETQLEVRGTLAATGIATVPVVFRSSSGTPTLGDWAGIRFIGPESSGSVLEYCRIEHATRGVYCEDSSPELAYCDIVGEPVSAYADFFGIYLLRSNAYIHHCDISHFLNDASNWARAIYMRESSPLVAHNEILDNEYGIHMYYGGNPHILDNTIEDYRMVGILCDGDRRVTNAPFPVINGNTIQTIYGDNDTYGLKVQRYAPYNSTDPSLVIDARDNYWGTASPEAIAAAIHQWPKYDISSPFVDYGGFLDGPGGSAVAGHYIPDGQLPADELTWTAAQGPYIVLGNAFVGTGQTLTVEPGTEVRFIGGTAGPQDRSVRASLRINGKLDAQGTAGNEILFTSHEPLPAQGDWEAIFFYDSADSTSVISYSRIEYAYNGIWCDGGSPTISHSDIAGISASHGSGVVFYGLRLESGSTATVTQNTITGFHNTYIPTSYGGRAIRVFNASPTISNNTLSESTWGIRITVGGTPPVPVNPMITGNDIVNNRYSAVEIWGDWNEGRNPLPQVNTNTFTTSYTDSSYYHVRTWHYGNAENTAVDFQGNWWGTNDPEEIGTLIWDWNDNSGAPVVDFTGYLGSEGGSPVPGTQITAGVLSGGDLHWTAANSPYLILGQVKVASGDTLTIDAGTEVRFAKSAQDWDDRALEVHGTLMATGTFAEPVVFKSNRPDPTVGDWTGIRFIGSTGSLLEYCRIEHATRGIWCEDSSPEIAYCDIVGEPVDTYGTDFFGIYLLRSNAHIHHCNISHFLNDASNWARAIYMRESSPLVEHNEILDNEYGIHMYYGGNPQILENTIEDYRMVGIFCDGDRRVTNAPFPVINGNTIQTVYSDNNTYGLKVQRYAPYNTTDPSLVIDARNNYWGTTLPQAIAAAIHQWPKYDISSPFVDYGGFLDGPGGSAVAGHYIPDGQLPADELTWMAAQGPYIVLGNTFVGTGQTLDIAPGTEVRFLGGKAGPQNRRVRASIRINGKLDAQGTAGNEILFTSHESSPVQGDWEAIIFNDTADNTSIISYSRIEYAYNGIWCDGGSPTISHNDIACTPGNYYHDMFNGLRVEAGSQAIVNDNTIHGFHNTYLTSTYFARAINIYNASPTIADNVLDENSIGLWVDTYNPPVTPVAITISGNSILNSHFRSVYVNGDNNDTENPVLTVNNNNIFSDYITTDSFYTANYGSGSAITVDATGNWWGTATTSEIEGIIRDKSDNSSAPVVDYGAYLGSDLGTFSLYNVTIDDDYFSPNGDGEQDSVTITGAAIGTVTWTVTIKDASGTTVRTYTGPLPWAWDGLNDGSLPCADGTYTIVVEGFDGTSTTVTRTLTTHIDTASIELLSIDAPTDGTTKTGTIDIQGTVSDANLLSYTLELGPGAAPASWTRLAGDNDTTADLHDGAQSIVNETLYTWMTNDTVTDTIPELGSLSFDNGPFTIRLTATDRAGNTSSETATVTLDNLFITGVSRDHSTINPQSAEAAVIHFTLNKTADVSLKIYPEWEGEDGGLLREITQSFAPGEHTMSWDGKNSIAETVPNEAYMYVLEASGGGRTDKYLPVTGHVVGSGEGTIPATYNFFTNQFWKIDYSMSNGYPAGRVSMEVTPSGEATFRTLDMEPHDAEETFTILWDGRRPNGTLVETTCNVYFPAPTTLRPNYVIVKSPSQAPVISGKVAESLLEVKADPYLVNFCYGEFTQLLYNLDRNAVVTIVILPPGVTDTASLDAITLVDSESQTAGDHEVSWDALDDVDQKKIIVSDEGVYTFVIEATASTETSTWKGVLNLYR